MGGCAGITDAGLAHLTGIHTLRMAGCRGVTGRDGGGARSNEER
jgi:hypothetical protein